MSKYPFETIEPKWQKFWEENKTFKVSEDPSIPKEKRKYVLDMFPYPSAAGLHVGHPEGYTATDIYCRYLRMNGYSVLHPMGFDAFGLPAENYAIKTGTHPAVTTDANRAHFTQQIKSLGFSYDWDRCVSTCDADYYKWTQWIFLKLFERGLAYESNTPINWCPSCKTGLANEEVKEGKCERCGSDVTHKTIRQWVLRITDYADRLLEDLDSLDWPESVKAMQRNWIGKSFGAEVDFEIACNDDATGTGASTNASEMGGNAASRKSDGKVSERIKGTGKFLKIFTTRADTLFGCTYMVISPEHPMLAELTTAERRAEVERYVEEAAKKSDLERTDLNKNKTGVFTGSYGINPVTGKKVPIWISDYVLISYGTGAIMAAPAHDERDWEFARKFDLPITKVVATREEVSALGAGDEEAGAEILKCAAQNPEEYKKCVASHPDIFNVASECTPAKDGYSINSGFITGRKTKDAINAMIQFLEGKNCGKKTVNYKLRDWIFSRQRYWGEPIPLVHCEKCGIVPLSEDDLPLRLPDVQSYQPTGTGESPLAAIESWVNCKCPRCGGKAKRETNTMPQWGGSCWYYLRYLDPKNEHAFCSPEKERYWMPVDLYVGGAEHAVLHLLYARFWHKVLYDIGAVSTKEPFQRLVNQGMITSFAYQRKNKTLVPIDEVEQKDDGLFYEKATGERLEQVVAKMSKSLKNVVNPDDEIQSYGADSVRMYEMFMGPLTMSKPWNTQGIIGIHRFLEKVWSLSEKPLCDIDMTGNLDDEKLVNLRKSFAQTVKKVTNDTATLNFNTAISQMMIFVNDLGKVDSIPRALWSDFVKMLSVYAPHIGEELWQRLGHDNTIAYEQWPTFSEEYLKSDTLTIVVMVNGKLRGKFQARSGASDDELIESAKKAEGVGKFMDGKEIVKSVVVKDKLVNFAVK